MKIKLRPGSLPPDWPLSRPETLIVTWFGTGLAPMASGTWGSLAALPLAWLAVVAGGWWGLAAATVAASLAGIWAAERIVAGNDVRDPGYIVIDEVAGMLLTLLFVPFTWWAWTLAFFLFRAADIVKPFPANWCDAHVHGGPGVMLDDLVAGLYAGLCGLLVMELGGEVFLARLVG